MKLSVKNRILILPLLPSTGGFIEMLCVKEIYDSVIFSKEEIIEFELKDLPNGAIDGNNKNFKDKEIEITESKKVILKNILSDLDSKKCITIQLLPLLNIISDL